MSRALINVYARRVVSIICLTYRTGHTLGAEFRSCAPNTALALSSIRCWLRPRLTSLTCRLKRVRHLAQLIAAIAALTFDAGVTHLAGAAFALVLAVVGRALRSGGADEGRCALRLALVDNVRLSAFRTQNTKLLVEAGRALYAR